MEGLGTVNDREQYHSVSQVKDAVEKNQITVKPFIFIFFAVLLLFGMVMPASGWNTPGCRESTEMMAQLRTCTSKLSTIDSPNPFYNSQPNAHIYTLQYAIKYFQDTGKPNWSNYLEEHFIDLAAGTTWADYYNGRAKMYLQHCFLFGLYCKRGMEIKFDGSDLGPYAAYDHYYDPYTNRGLRVPATEIDRSVKILAQLFAYPLTGGIYSPGVATDPDIRGVTFSPANELAEDHYQKALSVWRMTPHEFWLKSSTYGSMSQESAAMFEAGHSLHLLQDTCFHMHLDTVFTIGTFQKHPRIENLGDNLAESCPKCHITSASAIPEFRKSVSDLSYEAAVKTLEEKRQLSSKDDQYIVNKEIYRTELYTVAFFSKLLTDMGISPEYPVTQNDVPPGPVPPSAYFSLSTESGYPPFSLTITEASTGDPTAWSWTFTGPIDVGSQPITSRSPPIYTLTQPGIVMITLTVSNSYGSSSTTKTVTVLGSAPVADFYLSPSYGIEPLEVTIYDRSIGIPSTWEWIIESPDKAPEKVYQKDLPEHYQFGAGTHRITLTVANAYGTTSRTRMVVVLPADSAEPPFQCPEGCGCNDPDLPMVQRCSDTPCGIVDGKAYYCTRPIPLVSCQAGCQCLLETDAIQIFGDDIHVPEKCWTNPCEVAGSISKYCYHEATGSCPLGCRCLEPSSATYQFKWPIRCSDTVCGYSGDPDTPSARDPKYCYREG